MSSLFKLLLLKAPNAQTIMISTKIRNLHKDISQVTFLRKSYTRETSAGLNSVLNDILYIFPEIPQSNVD